MHTHTDTGKVVLEDSLQVSQQGLNLLGALTPKAFAELGKIRGGAGGMLGNTENVVQASRCKAVELLFRDLW